MSILITQCADGLFKVVVSDMQDMPSSLLPAVQSQCRHHSIKALFITPNYHTSLWHHALRAITPYVAHGLHVQRYEVKSGTAIAAGLLAVNPVSSATALPSGLGSIDNLDLQQVLLTQSEIQNALTIQTQVSSDAQQQQMQR